MSSLVSGYTRIRLVTRAHALTGHNSLCADECIVTVSKRWAFFWSSNVIEMALACMMCGEERGRTLLWRKNRKFRSRSRLVLRSVPETVRYSQDLMAKKKAPVQRSAMAFVLSVGVFLNRRRRIHPGRAFCCFGGGSWFLYALYCADRRREGFPSGSSLGSGSWLSRKV